MIGEREGDRCYFCGGRLTMGMATLPFVIDTRVIIIKRVPAEVCTQCGEAIVASQVAEEVDHLLKRAAQSGFEVSILTYAQAEPVVGAAH